MKRLLFLLMICTTLLSCEKDIEVKVPAHAPKLVIYSITMEGEFFNIHVSKSEGVLTYNSGHDLNVANATVLLYDSDKVVDTLEYQVTEGIYKSGIAPVAGHTYTIKVSAPDLPEATAKATTPQVVEITSLQRRPDVKRGQFGMMMDELTVSFSDPEASKDYYQPYFISSNGVYGCVESLDPSIERMNSGEFEQDDDCHDATRLYLGDALFNGKSKDLKLITEKYYLDTAIDLGGFPIPSRIELRRLTEAHFRYIRTLEFMKQNDGNPFAEPVNVYTNVENGYGIFSIMSRSIKDIP